MSISGKSMWKKRAGVTVFILSVVIWISVSACYAGCWDQVTAITQFPYWLWIIPGGLATYIAFRLTPKRSAWLLILPWVFSVLYFEENLFSMLRLLRKNPSMEQRSANSLRIVTLNCAGKSAAAAEVETLHPDIVLLQEIPSTNDLVRLATKWFGDHGSVVAGLDCAILARVPLTNLTNRFPPQYVRALALLKNGCSVVVTSLRFIPPAGRVDLWNPEAWKSAANNRRLRREQLQSALERGQGGNVLPEILGGDFNTSVPDAIFKVLTNFHDSFQESGRGWGNTALNNLPIVRPDQIWLKGFQAISVCTVRTRNSDHRIVQADVEMCP